MRVNPSTTLTLDNSLFSEKQVGMSSEHTTATIAPAENANTHGNNAVQNKTKITPKRHATISTNPENCATRKLFLEELPAARSGKATHIPSGKF